MREYAKTDATVSSNNIGIWNGCIVLLFCFSVVVSLCVCVVELRRDLQTEERANVVKCFETFYDPLLKWYFKYAIKYNSVKRSEVV